MKCTRLAGRSQAGVCVLDGRIVAIGGCDAWNPMNTVEVYDPEEDKWTNLPAMNTNRRGLGAAVFKGNHFDQKLQIRSFKVSLPNSTFCAAMISLHTYPTHVHNSGSLIYFSLVSKCVLHLTWQTLNKINKIGKYAHGYACIHLLVVKF